MNFGEFLHLHPENIKKLIRKIENLENKLVNARVPIVFNKTCLNENLLPTFTNIYIYIYVFPYLVLLRILEFFPARLATLPYGPDSNVTKLLANLLITKPSVFYYFADCIL